MPKDGVSNEVYRAVLEAIQSGVHRAKDIEQLIPGKTDRQIRRALVKGLEAGEIHRPERGVYYLPTQTFPLFDEFQKSYISNGCMSENNKQNNTYDTDLTHSGFRNNLYLLNSSKEPDKQQEKIRTYNGEEKVRTSEGKRTLEDTVHLIMREAGFARCSEKEFDRCCKKIAYTTWEIIDESNVRPFVTDCLDRFAKQKAAYKADGSDITNPVKYFFGIVGRAIGEWVMEIRKRYLESLRAGDETFFTRSVEATDSFTQASGEVMQGYMESASSLSHTEAVESVSGPAEYIPSMYGQPKETEQEAAQEEPLPPEWEELFWDFQLLCTQRGSFPVKDSTVRNAVLAIKASGMKVEHASAGLWYLKDHDEVGAHYVCEHLNEHQKVLDSLVRHYRRFLGETKPLYPAPSESPRQVGKSKERDERYSRFYELYPDQ